MFLTSLLTSRNNYIILMYCISTLCFYDLFYNLCRNWCQTNWSTGPQEFRFPFLKTGTSFVQSFIFLYQRVLSLYHAVICSVAVQAPPLLYVGKMWWHTSKRGSLVITMLLLSDFPNSTLVPHVFALTISKVLLYL